MPDFSIDRGGVATSALAPASPDIRQRTFELTIIAQNAANPLPQPPLSDVIFEINGHPAPWIANTGTAVSVNVALAPYNLSPSDCLTATYDIEI